MFISPSFVPCAVSMPVLPSLVILPTGLPLQACWHLSTIINGYWPPIDLEAVGASPSY